MLRAETDSVLKAVELIRSAKRPIIFAGHGMIQSDDKVKGATLSWDFVRRFAIVGSPDHCIERLLQLASLGIERFVIVGPGFHPEAGSSPRGLFVSEVLPEVRRQLALNRSAR